MSDDQKFELIGEPAGAASSEKGHCSARAQLYLRGPRIISEPGATFARLIKRYIGGEGLDSPEFQVLLSDSIRTAQFEVQKRKEAATGMESDALVFYERSAAVLQEIQADIRSTHR